MGRFVKLVETVNTLDKRWVFLVVGAAVVISTIFRLTFPEIPTPMVRSIFDTVEGLPAGSRVLLPFDYDPGSEPELQPMADAYVRHCAEKRLQLYFIALWPLGQNMVDATVSRVLNVEYPSYQYGRDYMNFGYKSGNEGVIAVILTDIKKLYTTDAQGANIDSIPMLAGISNIRGFDLILTASAGYPGLKEWIQYAGTPGNIPVAGGCTAVQAPLLYPYYPEQMVGLMGGIKAAAEYEALLLERYPKFRGDKDRFQTALTRMGPQTVTHLVIILFIVIGNIAYQILRRRRRQAQGA